MIEIGVGEDNVRTFAAEFEGNALEIGFRGVAHDEFSNFSGAGEGNFVHVHVASERCASGGAVAGKKIDDAFGKSSFEDKFTDA